MPEKLNPGPLAARMSFLAPISLLFFFFMILATSLVRDLKLHPLHFLFLGGAFFSFHLLFAYIVDHMPPKAAFLICSAVSLLLVVSYMRLVAGWRFALVETGLAQIAYLVLFSYAFFFEGFTGLSVAILSVLTLFVVMQLTGKVDWEKKLATGSQTPEPDHGAPVPPPPPDVPLMDEIAATEERP